MSNKPEIFKPDIDEINNNEKAYYSFLYNRIENKSNINSNGSFNDPVKFIDKLGRSGSYMFNKRVIIKTQDKIYDTKIAGKMGDRIVTLDKNSININDIKDIYEK